MKNFPQRKSIRLKNCDYSENGFYYVTVCTQNRECLFGDIIDRKMVLNGAGKIIQNIWELLPGHYSVKLDAFQIMPNHVHFIIRMDRDGDGDGDGDGATTRVARTRGDIVGAGFMPARPRRGMPARPRRGMPARPRRGMPARDDRATTRVARTLGDVVGGFKSITSVEYIKNVKKSGWKPFDRRLWQRNYYEHIVRTENDLDRIRQYIKINPIRWSRDKNNPHNCKIDL